MAQSSTVAVTGIGAVSSAGAGVAALWSAAIEEKSFVEGGLARIPPEALGGASDALSLALSAIHEAMKQAGWDRLEPEDGLILGTTAGQAPLWEEELPKFRQGQLSASEFAHALRVQPLGSLVEALRKRNSFQGPALLISSACSASTQAIALGALWIQQKRVKRCLVGGVESLSKLTAEGFKSLQLLSQQPCSPFGAARAGINLGEGAGFLCLESAESAQNALAFVSGSGMTSDAYHMTSPHPEGLGSLRAMRSALEEAGLSPEEIDWVHAHGTGSQANDAAEGKAIAQLGGRIPVSSTKRVHGHTLGAAGAIEAILCVEAIQRGRIPRTAGLSQPDPEIPAEHVRDTHPERGSVRVVVKSTLGFGGNNAVLALTQDVPPKLRKCASRASREAFVVATGLASAEDALALKSRPEFRKASRVMSLASSALSRSLEALGPLNDSIRESMGLVLGSSLGELEITQEFLTTLAQSGMARPILFQNSQHHATLGFLTLQQKLTGPALTVSNRYFTAENAIEAAQTLIASGKVDLCAAVAVDARVAAFEEALSLSRPAQLRAGEGAASVILASEEALKRLGLSELAVLESVSMDSVEGDREIGEGEFHDSDMLMRWVREIQSGSTGSSASAGSVVESLFIKPDRTSSIIRWRRRRA